LAAAELLLRWVEQCDKSGETFLLECEKGGGTWSISFREAFLRSHAFEALLDTCIRASTAREALEHIARAEALEGFASAEGRPLLAKALSEAVDRVLLPGTLTLWPGLLEALLLGGADDRSFARSLGKKALRWGPWARHVLAALKRAWQCEALPSMLRQLDQRLCDLARPVESTGSEVLRSTGRLSKRGIRAALAEEKLQAHAAQAKSLQTSSELLFGACSQLSTAESTGSVRVPKLERLLTDCDDAIASLGTWSSDLEVEHENLGKSLQEVGYELQKQITGVLMTQESFLERRGILMKEREEIAFQLSEIDINLSQIDKEVQTCERQVQQLRGQLSGTTAHFEEKMVTTQRARKELSDEKIRAISCKECVHLAIDVARSSFGQYSADLDQQLQRRRTELRRSLSAFVRQQRLQLTTAMECLDAAGAVPVYRPSADAEGANSDVMEQATRVNVAIDEVWSTTQDLLQRARPYLEGHVPDTAEAELSPDDILEGEHESPTEQTVTEVVRSDCERGDQAEAVSVAQRFFEQQMERGVQCVDCHSYDAKWASVSYGTYLCMDCAGRHRGLGVHLSFVRSTSMDRWTSRQLRLMQVGGNEKFLSFLEGYPQLSGAIQTQEACTARYSSRAAQFYRDVLDAACRGTELEVEPPSAQEGCLQVTAHTTSSSAVPPVVALPSERSESEDTAELSLEDETVEFEAAFARCQRVRKVFFGNTT